MNQIYWRYRDRTFEDRLIIPVILEPVLLPSVGNRLGREKAVSLILNAIVLSLSLLANL